MDDANKPDDETSLMQQAAEFWQEQMQLPGSNPADWRHLLSFQLRFLDQQLATGAADASAATLN